MYEIVVTKIPARRANHPKGKLFKVVVDRPGDLRWVFEYECEHREYDARQEKVICRGDYRVNPLCPFPNYYSINRKEHKTAPD